MLLKQLEKLEAKRAELAVLKKEREATRAGRKGEGEEEEGEEEGEQEGEGEEGEGGRREAPAPEPVDTGKRGMDGGREGGREGGCGGRERKGRWRE